MSFVPLRSRFSSRVSVVFWLLLQGILTTYTYGESWTYSRTYAQRVTDVEIPSLFKQIPDSIIPHFTPEIKSELLDAYRRAIGDESVEVVRNRYGGVSEITKMSDTYLQVKIDERVTLEIKLFQTRKHSGQLLGLVWTDNHSPAASILAFYLPKEGWRRCDIEEVIELPKSIDFVRVQNREDLDVKDALVERGLWSYTASFGENNESLSMKLTTFQEHVAQKLHPSITSKLYPSLVYHWNKQSFVLE